MTNYQPTSPSYVPEEVTVHGTRDGKAFIFTDIATGERRYLSTRAWTNLMNHLTKQGMFHIAFSESEINQIHKETA